MPPPPQALASLALAAAAAAAPPALAAAAQPAEPQKVLCDAACVAVRPRRRSARSTQALARPTRSPLAARLASQSLDKIEMVTLPSGLQYRDIVVGEGPTPPVGFQARGCWTARRASRSRSPDARAAAARAAARRRRRWWTTWR